MSSTTTTITGAANNTTASANTRTISPRKSIRSLRKSTGFGPGLVAASTPNLNALYAAHSRVAPAVLSRKASLTALTQSSLATIPDATETYAFDTVLSSESSRNMVMAPVTPGRPSTAGGSGDLSIGDTVDVPGNMYGTVRFVGTVQGKKGSFVGVELHPEFAVRGKNNGDVDGYETLLCSDSQLLRGTRC
jgi:hypothetical protein